MSFFEKFKRTTSSSFYLPQVDGLRFLALVLVIVQMHITHYIDKEFFHHQLITKPYYELLILEGMNGVYLFYTISGFILGLPFARSFLLKNSKVNLKNYYLRRLIRLEPPYILALTLCFAAHILIIKKFTFTELWPHFVASVFYLHNTIYQKFSFVMPVAWTLEIEVQFYLLAPFFCLIYLLPKHARWWLYAFILIGGIYNYHYFNPGMSNVYWFISFFYAGIMLADLYANKVVLIKNRNLGLLAGILSLLLFVFIISRTNMYLFYVKFFSGIVLFYTVLTNDRMKEIFSSPPVVLLGGMCYSIYLVHFAVLSLAGTLIMKSGLDVQNTYYIGLFFLLFLAAILLASAIYFYFIEKPFMNFRISWFQKDK